MTEELVVVTCHFNPMAYHTRRTLTAAFQQHMQDADVPLITVECALGHLPFEATDATNLNHLQVRCGSVLWLKENLINLGIQRALHLYPHAKYIGWFDADITFRNVNWVEESIRALQRYKVIQPWSDVYDLGPNRQHMKHFKSFCHQYYHRKPWSKTNKYEFWHPGFAWIARRECLEGLGGLFELAILGSGDWHMALALIGKAEESFRAELTASYAAQVYAWQARAEQHVGRQLGYVEGTIEHSWHGRKVDRRYVDRWQILKKHAVDPIADTKKNLYGVLELADTKPEYRHDSDLYFFARNEDANTMG